jgi:hypothetical protein
MFQSVLSVAMLMTLLNKQNITLVDLQIVAQNFCLFPYKTFIKTLHMFRALPCSSSGGRRCNCIYAASRMTIPEAAYIQI